MTTETTQMTLIRSLHTLVPNTVCCPFNISDSFKCLLEVVDEALYVLRWLNCPFFKKPPVPVTCWALRSPQRGSMTLRSGDWDGPPEPSGVSAVANDRSTWPGVLDHGHVGASRYVSCAASGLMRADLPPVLSDNMLHSSYHRFWPGSLCLCSSQWSTSMFTVGMVCFSSDSSPNVMFKKFNFGLITPENFQKFWGSSLCCLVFCKLSFFWRLDDVIEHLQTATPLFLQRVCLSAEVICGFSLHPEQFAGSCGWTVCWSTWLWLRFNRIPHFPLPNYSLNTADWPSQFTGYLFISSSCYIKFNYCILQILW